MIWSCGRQFLALVLGLLLVRRGPDRAKDLEIALLRRQLLLLQREQLRPPRLSGPDTRLPEHAFPHTTR
jgi:hypothetical protein